MVDHDRKEKEENMNIQNFLHLERERQGLSKKEIAERAGCSDTAISFWELGKRRIGFSYAESILNALGYELVLREKLTGKEVRE